MFCRTRPANREPRVEWRLEVHPETSNIPANMHVGQTAKRNERINIEHSQTIADSATVAEYSNPSESDHRLATRTTIPLPHFDRLKLPPIRKASRERDAERENEVQKMLQADSNDWSRFKNGRQKTGRQECLPHSKVAQTFLSVRAEEHL